MLKWLIVVLALTVGCASHTPPNLSPQAVTAWHGTQVIKTLDLLRDSAISAHETAPPLLTEGETRKVVTWHESAIKVVHDTPNGWEPALNASFAELLKDLPAGPRQLLSPYLTLVQEIIREVRR